MPQVNVNNIYIDTLYCQYPPEARPGATPRLAFGEFVTYHVHGLFYCVADAHPPLPATLDDR
jgi:hypothetical protein